MRGMRTPGGTWLLALALLAVPAASAVHAQEIQYNQAQLVRSLLPTVVNIMAHSAVGGSANADLTAASNQGGGSFQIRSSAGSGFVVDPSGVIVTNWHVVDGAYEIYVTFSDGERARAEVFNAARIIDIALLKITVGRKLAAITWGDSARVEIGDPVLAIGNPMGVGQSVTAGIVSALNRNIMDTPYDDFIQTDAPINHGNSGGPLFNLHGELIGINTALISSTSSSAGLGFAIPANDARAVIDRLIHFGWVRPGYMGMKIQQLTPDMAAAMGLADDRGSIVAWLADDGPAAKSGLRVGDVIRRFNGREPSDERELLRTIASGLPGAPASLDILRDGEPMQLHATLAEWPKTQWEQRDGPVRVPEPHWNIPHDLGIKVTPLTDDLRAQNEIPPGPPGVLVTGVTQDADAARRGVAPGDVVQQVGSRVITSAADMQQGIDAARATGRTSAMFLVLPKASPETVSKAPGPKWLALRISG